MPNNRWKSIKKVIPISSRGAIPGVTVLGLVILARLLGWLQPLEWSTLDTFLRFRLSESRDERITIIGINEKDIKRLKTYPIPDEKIAQLIKILQKYKPSVIGLDNVRDLPVEPGHQELIKVFKDSKNLIGIEKVLPPEIISPPPSLPPEQLGFSDAIPDADGKYRRSLLGVKTPQGYKFSLTLRLAENYLKQDGIFLENGLRDRHAMRFGNRELNRFLPNTGGYVKTDAGGVQILLNYRNGKDSFRLLSLNDIITGNFNPEWIRNRLILIGITTSSTPDFVSTDAVSHPELYGQIYGVIYQAHAISQIISAVKDGRPLLQTWSDTWEYLWIFTWGILAIYIGHLTQSVWQNLLAISTLILGVAGLGYIGLIWGWWLPIAPAFLILAINGVGLSAFAFYQHDRALRLQIKERQEAIDKAFTAIHNRPLQQIAIMSRYLQAENISQEQLLAQLQTLNNDIRDIFEHLKQDALSYEKSLLLDNNLKINLEYSISELLYEVYRSVQKRNYPNFQGIKIPVVDFQPMKPEHLTIEQKRQICRFLEEALCNVGKHAQGVTRIKVTGKQNQDWYIIRIEDNGVGITSKKEGQGTKDAHKLAKQLGGKFKRESLSPKGILCELTLPVSRKRFNLIAQFNQFFKNK